ncbi:MAG: 2'-5' RNA ligase family protein [Lachnospiraceae bacterium]|nr:2'-5' RNA ligase family protein [Lachnospiraceae bacterium]
MYLVSVYFDEKANKILQRYIDKIAEVTGNDFMTSHKVPPHMTISAIEARDIESLVPAFNSLKNKLKTGTIDVVTVGQLLPYVMYGGAVMNEYLLDLSKVVYEAFKDVPDTSISKYYQPLSWLPHITLGKTLGKNQMAKAFSVLQESFAPISATVTRIGLAKVNPHEDVATFELN